MTTETDEGAGMAMDTAIPLCCPLCRASVRGPLNHGIHPNYDGRFLQCIECGLSLFRRWRGQNEQAAVDRKLIAAWNRRPDDEFGQITLQKVELIDALTQALDRMLDVEKYRGHNNRPMWLPSCEAAIAFANSVIARATNQPETAPDRNTP